MSTIELGSVLGIGLAFVAGLASFASPCCLPLVPAYISYMLGATGQGTTGRRPAFLHGLAFSAGFTLVFIAFYALLGVIGAFVDRRYLNMVIGAAMIFMGLQVAGIINVRALWRDTRVMPSMGGGLVMAGGAGGSGTTGSAGVGALVNRPGSPAYPRSFVFGLLFAAGWSPCIGPILGGIIGIAAATATFAQGTMLLLAYAAGLAIPFIAVAMGASVVARRMSWFGRHHHAVNLVTGALLVILGVLMFTNTLGRLSSLTSPFGL
jgi:cytochrome c-type biogenesis protein